METIKLNLIPTGSLPVVHTSQYDEGRVFRIELFEGSAVYSLDGTEVLECDVKKPDGNIVTIAIVNTSDNYVDVETTLQMNACAGESFGELHIKKGAQEIGTLNFILAVERSPLENGIQSDSGIHNLQTQIADAVADQYAAEDVVFDATPTAGHGVGFAVTSEGVKNALDAVAATIPEELDDLQDVTTSAPTAGQILEYDDNDGKWKNVANPASTTNFGAPYDEITTYNVPSLVIYNNLLYKLNEGEDGTTGPWDPTKWTQTSVAELAALIGSLSSLTTTDKSSLVGAVNEVNNRLGNRLVGAWTADSSTSNLQILTDDIDVEAGTYLIIMSYPDTSANFVACLYNRTTSGVYDNCYISGGSWTSKSIITAFSGNGKLCITSAQGATCNFTNKNRGSIRAIKLSNLY